jgi:hypothetical protein
MDWSLVKVKNRIGEWQQQTAVRSLVVPSLLQPRPLSKESYITCVFSEVVISKCCSKFTMYNSASMKVLSLDIVPRDRNCEVYLLDDNPTCERCLEEDDSATHILCDCEAIAS